MSSDQPQSPSIPMVVAADAAGTVPGPLGAALRNRGFIACLALLIGVAVCFQLIGLLGGRRPGKPKEAVWLKKSLKQLDRTKLAPYILPPGGAADIKAEILDSLGTREYISWTLEDPTSAGPASIVNFFVTYYTDDPGQVPHVPEECYSGNGYSAVGEEQIEIPVPALGKSVAFKMLTFERSAFLERESRLVMYAFHANGRFASERRMVQMILNDPRDDHAYFSKIELSFGTIKAQPTREEAIAAGTRFLQRALPVLVQDHWPDWEEVKKKEADARSGAKSE